MLAAKYALRVSEERFLSRMIAIRPLCLSIFAALSLAGLDACGGSSSGATPQATAQLPGSGSGGSPIQHIVLIVQENRSFNNLFAGFPGATGAKVGKMWKNGKDVNVTLKETNLEDPKTLNHTYPAYQTAYRNGNMDAFNLIKFQLSGKNEGAQPYQYVNPSQIQPYWQAATIYALSDELFQTQGSGSFIAHQDLIRGGTAIDASHSLVDDPTGNGAWGCDSSPGTKTSLITTNLKYLRDQGPYPCTTKFPQSGSYTTLQNLLDAKSVSWKYYTPAPVKGTVGALWNAYLVISSVYNNQSEWEAHISSPETNILSDISNNALPSMSWVIPDAQNSDHPGYSSKDTGPSWVASIVNAIGASNYWNSTAVIIVWDDWGGFYDPVAPSPLDDQGGPGFRVPMIVVSPYVPQNEISHTVYGFGSIIRFIEDTWSLGRLGTTDGTSKTMADMFNFNQSPRNFVKIPSSFSKSYFLRQKPSGLPVDTE